MKPILVGRSFRTASFLPQLVSQSGNVIVTEPASLRCRFSVRAVGTFLGLPRLFAPGQMFSLAVLFGDAMGMSADIVEFGRPLMILVMRSAVVTG